MSGLDPIDGPGQIAAHVAANDSGAPDSTDPVRAALINPVAAPQLAAGGDPGPEIAGSDGDHLERPPFPQGGPVKPLGIASGLDGSMRCFYLDSLGQIVARDVDNKHGKNALIGLYGDKSPFIEEHWPQWSKPVRDYNRSTKEYTTLVKSVIIGFDQAEASRAHIEECVRRGIFDSVGKLRGRGAHRTDTGHLLMHLGNTLLIPEVRATGKLKGYRFADPGVHAGYVYPAREASARPHHASVGPDIGERVLTQLKSWSFRRAELDPHLLLGAIVASMLGGFLTWRPAMWIVGPRGTGKSTLDGEPSASEGFIGHLLGPARMNSADTTAAGIRQTLLNSTVPVFIDELEPDAGRDKIDAIIALARIAAGGAKGHRGGQDHKAQEFTLRSPFWFSSVLQVMMQPTDRSRFVTIELKKLRGGLKKPSFFELGVPAMGARLLRRVIDQAERLDATIARYAEALGERGLDARGQDVYGTLLACADIVLSDDMPDDATLTSWALLCDPSSLNASDEALSEERGCLDHLLTSQVQARGGDERVTLSRWVADAIEDAGKGLHADESAAARRLQQWGLKLVNLTLLGIVDGPDNARTPRWGTRAYAKGHPGWLAVAWKHRALDPLFMDTKWRGGVWRQALARIELVLSEDDADIAARNGGDSRLTAIDGLKVKFDRISANAVLIPLAAILDADELPVCCTPLAASQWLAGALL